MISFSVVVRTCSTVQASLDGTLVERMIHMEAWTKEGRGMHNSRA